MSTPLDAKVAAALAEIDRLTAMVNDMKDDYRRQSKNAADRLEEITRLKAQRRLAKEDAWCPSCGHNRNTSSVSSIYLGDSIHQCQLCQATWGES